ncbi:sulfotransferase family 2 domain-containing protein [Beggiatoa leptomitoformis]|uniref:Sulfotransferase n=1 Tax=Beggiatoa leptomitoformis TaxID=288004 RepID=A0A2N9YBE3_9GAMM|nr:sulfotransferase family 2 domain-containing protein [Beggiatoa leptomitoformis]ALG66850.1 sulfotransferase [Beggiatoa leptomitoformis]AUI67797.1 sulfotransferase [Beggiatoa leptomitoformis]
MLISNTHQFIFFHVAKVAGISIREALKAYVQEPDIFKIKRPTKILNGQVNPLYTMWETMLLHARACDAKKALPVQFKQFYKFAFVRNPWDWQVSMYHFLLKETTNPRYELVKSFPNFETYLEWVIQTKKPFPKGATKLQKEVLTDEKGNLLVDYIGRYETLTHDFQQICQALQLTNTVLPHLNQSNRIDYKTYYTPYTRQLVADHFAEDIALFGYQFDGICSPIQPLSIEIVSL